MCSVNVPSKRGVQWNIYPPVTVCPMEYIPTSYSLMHGFKMSGKVKHLPNNTCKINIYWLATKRLSQMYAREMSSKESHWLMQELGRSSKSDDTISPLVHEVDWRTCITRLLLVIKRSLSLCCLNTFLFSK